MMEQARRSIQIPPPLMAMEAYVQSFVQQLEALHTADHSFSTSSPYDHPCLMTSVSSQQAAHLSTGSWRDAGHQHAYQRQSSPILGECNIDDAAGYHTPCQHDFIDPDAIYVTPVVAGTVEAQETARREEMLRVAHTLAKTEHARAVQLHADAEQVVQQAAVVLRQQARQEGAVAAAQQRKHRLHFISDICLARQKALTEAHAAAAARAEVASRGHADEDDGMAAARQLAADEEEMQLVTDPEDPVAEAWDQMQIELPMQLSQHTTALELPHEKQARKRQRALVHVDVHVYDDDEVEGLSKRPCYMQASMSMQAPMHMSMSMLPLLHANMHMQR